MKQRIETKTNEAYRANKILTAYFSQTSNTRTVAEAVHEAAGGALFEIQAETPYPENYGEIYVQSKREVQTEHRPPLKTKFDNLEEYDIIFIGTPVWWNMIAPPVRTFLSENNLQGKTVVPFFYIRYSIF